VPSRVHHAWPVLLVAALAACPQRTAVWVEPGSTVERLRFQVAERRGGTEPLDIGLFRVDRCGAWAEAGERPTPMWGAGTSRPLSVIEYGVMPPGAMPLIGQADTALTLIPGCYEAMISGTGHTVFDVTADGHVIEREAQ
jgi:hypothetical protein